MAANKIVPFIDRLITPARSDIVSPITAKSTGAAEARTPANPIINVSAFIIQSPQTRRIKRWRNPSAIRTNKTSTPCNTPESDESIFRTIGN